MRDCGVRDCARSQQQGLKGHTKCRHMEARSMVWGKHWITTLDNHIQILLDPGSPVLRKPFDHIPRASILGSGSRVG